MEEKTILASTYATTRAPNYIKVLNTLSAENIRRSKRKLYVSMRIGTESGLLSYGTKTAKSFAKYAGGWSYQLAADVLFYSFAQLLLVNGAYAVQDKEPTLLNNLSFFHHYKRLGTLQSQYNFSRDDEVIGCVSWKILEDEKLYGEVYIIRIDDAYCYYGLDT